MATEKQKKFIQILSVNLGNAKPKSLYEMLLEAGYEKSTAKQQSGVLFGIKDEMKSIVNKMIEKRNAAIDKLNDDKLTNSSARDNAYIADILTKNIELLSGRPTDRNKIDITDVEIKLQNL